MTRALSRLGRSLRRGERGASAVELALILPLFTTLLFSFYDIGAYMLRQVTLSSSLDTTVRALRLNGTLRADDQPTTIDDFVASVCGRTFLLSDCANTLTVDMREVPYDPTQPIALPPANGPCIDRTQPVIRPATTFVTGRQASLMFVRVCGVAPPLTPGLGFAGPLTNDQGDIVVRATGAFTNE